MATFKDLGEQYAQWLQASAEEDRGLIKKSATITESVAGGSDVASTLKKIDEDLGKYVVDGKPLTDDQRKSILEVTRQTLGLPSSVSVYLLVKEASVDNFTELTDLWDDFFDNLNG